MDKTRKCRAWQKTIKQAIAIVMNAESISEICIKTEWGCGQEDTAYPVPSRLKTGRKESLNVKKDVLSESAIVIIEKV